jgi:hypothetical protein
MTETNEMAFTNSSLHTTMQSTKNVKKFYDMTEYALSKQPQSKFWQEAFEFISKKVNKNISKK